MLHFVRAGLEFGGLKRERFSTAIENAPPRLSVLFPSYVGLWGRQYLNLATPGYFFNKRDSLRELGIGLNLAYGYAPGKPSARFRPYLALEGSASLSWINVGSGANLGKHNYQLGTLLFYPQPGLLARIAGHFWAEIALPAPVGFTFLETRLYSDQNTQNQVFARSIRRGVPSVQVAVLYQIR